VVAATIAVNFTKLWLSGIMVNVMAALSNVIGLFLLSRQGLFCGFFYNKLVGLIS
jgi:hypothetical protein